MMMCTRTTSPVRVESMSKIGSFAESIDSQPLYPRQELRSLDTSFENSESSNNCDSCSSSSCSSTGSDSYDESDRVRTNELSASGSFAESVQSKSATRTMYPQSFLIPSSSSAPDELSDTIPPPPPPPSLSSLSNNCRRQLFKQESKSKSNSTSGEQQIIDNNTGQYPSISYPIQSNNSHNTNNEVNLIHQYSDTEETPSNNEWLQSSTDYYSNVHGGHTPLPVVLEGDEAGAISSSPDVRQRNHKRCEIEIEIEDKIETKTKTSNLCGSTNGESLDMILTTHNFFHEDDERKSDHHLDKIDIDNLKVDPCTYTIGSDTCQTQSLSNHSSSTASNNPDISPCQSANTHQQNLEEELDSRLQVIVALKDAVVMQNRKSKKAERLSRKTNSKLITCAKTNRKLTKKNLMLEEQMESLQQQLGEMRQQMVEAEIGLMQERRRRGSRKSGRTRAKNIVPLRNESQESSDCDISYDRGNYGHDVNNDLASF